MAVFETYNRAKQCRYGTLVYNFHDLYVGKSLDAYGEFSEGEIELFRQFITPGKVVVEVGANVGAHTVFLAQAVGMTGAVFAFEPQRLVFQTLCANLALNNIANVIAHHAAVGQHPGEIIVPLLDFRKEQNFGGLALGDFKEGEKVPVMTIDGLNLGRCDLIKVDVEGMEQLVLAGATKTIARCKPVLYVENDRQEKAAALVRAIDAMDYNLYWHTPPLFNPNNFAANPVNVFGQIVSLNMLCVPRAWQQNITGLQPVDVPRAS